MKWFRGKSAFLTLMEILFVLAFFVLQAYLVTVILFGG